MKFGLKTNLFLLIFFALLSIFLVYLVLSVLYGMLQTDTTTNSALISVLVMGILLVWFCSPPIHSTLITICRIRNKVWKIDIGHKNRFVFAYVLNLVLIFVFIFGYLGYGLLFIILMTAGNFHSGHRKYLRIINLTLDHSKPKVERNTKKC